MSNLVAVHEIIQKGADGKREVIAPGTAFTASDRDAEFYLKVGAARESHAVTEEPDLAKLKKADLVEIATGVGIEGAEAMNKQQLLDAIAANDTDESVI